MYERYRIDTRSAPHRNGFPGRFTVERGEGCINCGVCVDACVYGVHLKQGWDSRLMDAPEENFCVGCQRCVMECPVGVLAIGVHPKFKALGDAYVRPRLVETIWQEARDGRIPVTGAGYRGPFVQPGFDAIWTDMSEIVRPTRDGIHGREYISTSVDVGRKPPYVDPHQEVDRPLLQVPMPFLFELSPDRGRGLEEVLARAATELGTYALLPHPAAERLRGQRVLPQLVPPEVPSPETLEGVAAVEILDGPGDVALMGALQDAHPEIIQILRRPLSASRQGEYAELIHHGVDALHLVATPHGREVGAEAPRFIAHILRDLDQFLVEEGVRDEVTLLASGGIVASEHVPKALLCGADAVVLDATVLIALGWDGSPQGSIPTPLDVGWGIQRIKNWANACRDQLLEIMGAMGIRDARRLAGEVGRAMFHEDLEAEFRALFPRGEASG